MVDAIGSASTNPYAPTLNGDDNEQRRATAAAAPKIATPPEIPDLPDFGGALLARAAKTATAAPRLLIAMGLDATEVRTDQDTPVEKGLNEFYASARPTVRLPDGGQVTVATPFRMVNSARPAPDETRPEVLRYFAQQEGVGKRTQELAHIAGVSFAKALTLQSGRGTPAEIQRLTQALIDAGKLPPPIDGQPDAARVRQMMCDYGIGLDCAGYAQQAFLAAHGLTRAQANLNANILNENLSRLSPALFVKVNVADARPGDIVSLGPPTPKEFGHRLIVAESHEAPPDELARYRSLGEGAKLGSKVQVLTVDSSFGSGGNPQLGGVQRQTWLYDAEHNQWARLIPATTIDNHTYPEHLTVTAKPYDGQHPLIGVYHYKGRS